MQKKILLRELTKLNILYNPKKSAEELQVIAGMWLEDLGHIPDKDFLECISAVRANTKWFPVPSDILDAYKEILSNPHYDALAHQTTRMLEYNYSIERPTAEEMKAASAELVEKLKRKFSMPEKPKPNNVIRYRRKTTAEKREHRKRVIDQARDIKAAE